MTVRRLAACAAAAATIAAVTFTGVDPAGAKAGTACDRGYLDPGPVTATQGIALPRIQAGLAANPAPYTIATLNSTFDQIDGNGDGLICLKSISNLRGQSGKHWAFFYGADDNTHPGTT